MLWYYFQVKSLDTCINEKFPIRKPHVKSVPKNRNLSPTWHLPMATGETYFHPLNIHPCRMLIKVGTRIRANRRCQCNYYSTLKVLNPNCRGPQNIKENATKINLSKELKIRAMYAVTELSF